MLSIVVVVQGRHATGVCVWVQVRTLREDPPPKHLSIATPIVPYAAG